MSLAENTLQGVGKFLKEHKPGVRVVAVEPKNVSARARIAPDPRKARHTGFTPHVAMRQSLTEYSTPSPSGIATEMKPFAGLRT